mgnify:CR=1 FL=1
MNHHIKFLKLVCQKWLQNDCKESPEDTIEIINSEYKGKSLEN